jgi:hypothetical protein
MTSRHLAAPFLTCLGLPFLALLAGWCPGSLSCSRTAATPPAYPGPYDPDPRHPWNRLHRLLHTRTMPDGRLYEREDLEPSLTPTSNHLIAGSSYREALAALDDFLKEHAADRIHDPVQRAVFQHDLWAVFVTLAGAARPTFRETAAGQIEPTGFEDPGDAELAHRPQRRELQKRLACIMRQVALTPEAIDALPDNLSDAARAETLSRTFDPRHPARPFLPPDLLDPTGPWVAVRNPDRSDGLAAPHHVRFTKGRSVFLAFVRTPGGRVATQADLKTTTFPAGTQVALLRRMFLVDQAGAIRPSRLTESVQLRVLCEPQKSHPAFELTLRRGDLFARRAGGLRPVGADEILYFNFGSGGQGLFDRATDPFEDPKPERHRPLVKACMDCHVSATERAIVATAVTPGRRQPVYASGQLQAQVGKSIIGYRERLALEPTDIPQQVRSSTAWTQKSYTWGLLQGLWETQPP